MNFIYFLLFSAIIFLLSLVCYEKFRSTTLYALSIGGAVNANFFHAGKYPIYCFGLPFGLDSIIFSVFVYCVIIMFLKVSKRDAYILTFSTVIAIMFSAVMQLVAELFTIGSCFAVWKTFLNFSVSAVASLIAVWVMLETLDRLKNKNQNQYVLMIVGMLIVSLLNSAIYYSIATWINGAPENIFILVLTSFIGKIIALACAIGALYLTSKIEKVIERRSQQV
jgi:hypothetical protein